MTKLVRLGVYTRVGALKAHRGLNERCDAEE